MSTTRHPTIALPVRTVGVEVVRGVARTLPTSALERLTVGSAADADVVIEAPGVSRYHVELSASGSGVAVRDLGSTNGVVSGTTFLSEAIVPPGTLLELGEACIRVTRGAPSTAPASAQRRLEGVAGSLVCTSAAMRKLAARLEAVASEALPVLVEGPPGSGKERVAGVLHALGRDGQPWVVVDCAALSPHLAASELFGHERGAFTDAGQARAGALERAGKGTLVLDEVASLSAALQPSLLGVLERRRFRRMGGERELLLEARVVATSTRDVRAEVNAGRLRLDLYYRLAGVRLVVPPLREREGDLPLLVADLLSELGHGASHPLAAEAAVEALAAQSWPGNVRELRAHLLAACIGEAPAAFDGDRAAAPDRAWMEALMAQPFSLAREAFEARFEHAYLSALRGRGTSVSALARLAGLDRSQLRGLLKRRGITV